MSGLTAATPAEELQEGFSGQVLTPASPGYDEARRVHNGLIDKRPALIARCLSTADVVDAVGFAGRHDLEVSVRGGGHNVAGRAVTDGGLMIDLAPMKGMHVDPSRRTARAQGGVTLREYNRAAGVFGLATPGGVVSTTGIAGLTLGGGHGWLMGRYGLAIDNLLSAEVVLASGDVVTAADDTEPDLFWAIRGGGGNFGVATWLEYRTHPLASVLGGPVLHPLAAATEVLAFYRDLAPTLPDELTIQAAFLHAPDGSGTKVCAIAVCHAGDDHDAAEAAVRPVRTLGAPIGDLIERMPYARLNTLLDDVFPRDALNYWKSAFLADLSDAAIDTLVDAFQDTPSDMCAVALEAFHGAVTRVDPSATAYPHRQPGHDLIIASQWARPEQTEAGIAWARDTFAALGPHLAPRSYGNYLAADDDDRVRQAYGANYDRLAAVKRRYDPDNVFHLNPNVAPAA